MSDDTGRTSADDVAEPAPDDGASEPYVESPQSAGSRRRYLAAFGVTVAVVVVVLALLPSALVSMASELRGQTINSVYDLFTGTEVDVDQTFGPGTAFINVTVTNLDELTRTATLTLSGHRICEAICPPTTGTFFSLGNDAAERRGLPPSAAVTIPGESGVYTFTIALPVQGTPQLYPFDNYTLLFGLVVSVTLPTGREEVVTDPEQVREARLPDAGGPGRSPQHELARARRSGVGARAQTDPNNRVPVGRSPAMGTAALLRILTVLLVILISASGIFALGMRTLHELVLGIGGIILGIWGVRSVVVQKSLAPMSH